MNLFNRGLSAFNYRFFLPEGRSAQQLKIYGEAVEKATREIERFAQARGAQCVQMCGGEDVHLLGLVFLKELPPGWEPYLALGAVPDESTDLGIKYAREMYTLAWRNPHEYLQAETAYDAEGRALQVLAGRLPDGRWLIASPIGEDSFYFTPQDAREISIREYCELLGHKNMSVPPSPSEVLMFDHMPERFPYIVRPDDRSLFDQRYEEASAAVLQDLPKPVNDASFLQKILRVFRGGNSLGYR